MANRLAAQTVKTQSRIRKHWNIYLPKSYCRSVDDSVTLSCRNKVLCLTVGSSTFLETNEFELPWKSQDGHQRSFLERYHRTVITN